MSYQTALTIKDIIKDIDEKKYLLPSIQREFVWNTSQIERLFDSLMQGYPIGAFLFWQVPKEKTSEFKFYEFLRNYHQHDSKHNPSANLNGTNDITAILDGQQRLTSLYIALKGTYSYRMPYKRWDNLSAYPERKMYLNLLASSTETDLVYTFSFLTNDEAKTHDENHYWFPVGEILNMDDSSDVNEYLINNNLTLVQKESNEDKAKAKLANKTLSKLFYIIHTSQTISYYLEKSIELDKVLNIFIRVNSGGTTLSYSDLLLSFAIAQWKKRDARKEIHSFVDEINTIGNGFNIGKDIVLKACLVLSDFQDISFKVDNFNNKNMLMIEQNWDEITSAIRTAIELIAYSRENITSNNLIIPIAYYIKSINIPTNFVDAEKHINDRKQIKKWFVSSLLRKVFSFMPDGVLKPIRELIQQNQGTFPYTLIVDKFKGTNRDLVFTEDNLANLLLTNYGSGNAIIIMSVLYPWANLRNHFHIDHIYPKSKFTTAKKLSQLGVSEDFVSFYTSNVNHIANLQLLEELPNKEKSDKDFKDWVHQKFSNEEQRKEYMKKYYIPNIDLSFTNFKDFFNMREKLLIIALKEKLM